MKKFRMLRLNSPWSRSKEEKTTFRWSNLRKASSSPSLLDHSLSRRSWLSVSLCLFSILVSLSQIPSITPQTTTFCRVPIFKASRLLKTRLIITLHHLGLVASQWITSKSIWAPTQSISWSSSTTSTRLSLETSNLNLEPQTFPDLLLKSVMPKNLVTKQLRCLKKTSSRSTSI